MYCHPVKRICKISKTSSEKVILTGTVMVICLMLVSPSTAHTVQHRNADVHLRVEDQLLRCTVHLRRDWFLAFLNRTDLFSKNISPDIRKRLQQQAERLFHQNMSVRINGSSVETGTPELLFYDHVAKMPPLAMLTFRIKPPEKIRTVSFSWDLFEKRINGLRKQEEKRNGGSTRRDVNEREGGILRMPLEINYRKQRRQLVLTPETPSYTWHHPEAGNPISDSKLKVQKRPARYTIPILSLLSLILIPAVLYAFSDRIPILVGGIAVLLTCSFMFRHHANVRFSSPWSTVVAIPDRDRARSIFLTLHRNVYRAFRLRDRGRIFDTVSRSCEGEYLEQTYREITRGIHPTGTRKAHTEIVKVQVLETKWKGNGRLPEPHFRIFCRWRVYGAVTHWKHTHARANEYAATFTVTARDRWKITGARVKNHVRIK